MRRTFALRPCKAESSSHGEEESSGRTYLMLQGTYARVHDVYYTPEVEAARNRGELRTNSFVQLRKSSAEGRPSLEIHDVGDTEAICVTSASCVRSGSILSRQPHLAKRAPPRRRCSQNFSTAHRALPTGIENGIEFTSASLLHNVLLEPRHRRCLVFRQIVFRIGAEAARPSERRP
jgi:hypothetical protein